MASNFVCTPSTKLRKDAEFLGIYATRFMVNSSGPTAPIPVKFKSSNTLTNNQSTSAPKKIQEKNFGVFYKKQGAASLGDEGTRRQARSQLERVRQKDKRSQKIMDKRKITTEQISTPGLLPTKGKIDANLKNSESSQPQKLSSMSANEIASSRKDQLQRWKEQKAAAAEAARTKISNKRLHAPANTISFTKPVQGQSIAVKNARIDNAPLTRKPPLIPSEKNMRQGSKLYDRRVTRAMTKAQIPSDPVAKSMQPAIAKMKYLSLHNKTRKAVEPVVEAKTQVDINAPDDILSKEIKQFHINPASSAVEDVNMTTIHESSVPENDSLKQQNTHIAREDGPAVPAPAASKKKIMALDKYYIEYNQLLAEACTTLMNYWTCWEDKRNQEKLIPEDVLSEIESTLGQAKLLMNSKLPQFVQLLYFYLSKENFPGPVLPCDLQGWWDVACIQVEKVKDRFKKLHEREKNDWHLPVESHAPSVALTTKPKMSKQIKVSSISCSSGESGDPVNTKPAGPQASLGLRQFLAKQREGKRKTCSQSQVVADKEVDILNADKVQYSSPISSQDKSINSQGTPTKNISTSATRQFEGGFFQVTSPLRTTNTNSVVARTPPVPHYGTSASHRTSLGHTSSLVTLAVRKSMGPIFKIGASSPLLMKDDNTGTKEQ